MAGWCWRFPFLSFLILRSPFRLPLRYFVTSWSCPFHVIFMSFALLRQGVCACLCVHHLDTSIFFLAGMCGIIAMKLWAWVGRDTLPVPCTCRHMCVYMIITTCTVLLRPWARLCHSWGDLYFFAAGFYSHCLPWFHFYIVYSSFIYTMAGVFAHPMHSATKFVTTVPRKCVYICYLDHVGPTCILSWFVRSQGLILSYSFRLIVHIVSYCVNCSDTITSLSPWFSVHISRESLEPELSCHF